MKIDKYVEKIREDGWDSLVLAVKTCPMYYKDDGHHQLDEDDFRDHCASLAAERLLFYWTGMDESGLFWEKIADDLADMAAKFECWAREYRRRMNGMKREDERE